MIHHIILLMILIYIVSGFFGKRSLRVKNGRWYYIAAWNKILFAINGSRALPIIPLPWPFQHVQNELTWTEYKKVNETYTALTSYSNVEKAIGIKSELTDIRLLEEHPIEINVILGDGFETTIIFDTTLSVFDPMKLLPRRNFLPFVQQEFSDIVSPWAHRNHGIESILLVEIREVKEQICFLIDGTTYNIWDYLNKYKFEEFGFCIKELSLKTGLDGKAKDYFGIKNQEKDEIAKIGLFQKIEDRRAVQRLTFTNDAATERAAQEKDLDVTKLYQIDVMQADYEGKSKVAASYKASTLIINSTGDESNNQGARNLANTTTAALVARQTLPPLPSPPNQTTVAP